MSISHFLHDLHECTYSNPDSEVVEIQDLKYSESFRSLQTDKRGELGFLLKEMVKQMRETQL